MGGDGAAFALGYEDFVGGGWGVGFCFDSSVLVS